MKMNIAKSQVHKTKDCGIFHKIVCNTQDGGGKVNFYYKNMAHKNYTATFVCDGLKSKIHTTRITLVLHLITKIISMLLTLFNFNTHTSIKFH